MTKKHIIISTVVTLVVCIIFCLSIGAYLYLDLSSFTAKPFDIDAGEKVFTIHSGQSLDMIAENLENESLISSKTYFKLLAKLEKSDKKIQAGEYLLSAAKSPEQILKTLVKGKVKLYRITLQKQMLILHYCWKNLLKKGLKNQKKNAGSCR